MPYLLGQPPDNTRQVLIKPPTLFTAAGVDVEPDVSYQPLEGRVSLS
jgi:hypothetical protein